MSNWDAAEPWYQRCVGEKGHYYHQSVILPRITKLLDLKQAHSLLDLGCGQGVLSRQLPKNVSYVGVDLSKNLIEQARKMNKRAECTFIKADICESLPIEKKDFDRASFILSLQNMKHGEKAILNASRHLQKDAILVLVLNHPCFRIPRQSSWGIDEKAKLQYRRINRYMTSLEIPLQIHPGKGEKSEIFYSYHHNLSDYAAWLQQAGFAITMMEEWCSDKKSEGAKAKMEDRSREEFPLFLAIQARKQVETI
ncbi:MAG: class I SAM-dependent methyltransferase [Chlamydiae bacterium]|nr:class I SAM-dependent methyltransferase [Chlamydiota bacterium]